MDTRVDARTAAMLSDEYVHTAQRRLNNAFQTLGVSDPMTDNG